MSHSLGNVRALFLFDSHNNPSEINGEVLFLFLFGRCGHRVPREIQDLAKVTELVSERSVLKSPVHLLRGSMVLKASSSCHLSVVDTGQVV